MTLGLDSQIVASSERSNVRASRVGYLDGLRGIAVLVVLGYHYYSYPANDPRSILPYGDILADFVPFHYGYYGVQLVEVRFYALAAFIYFCSPRRFVTAFAVFSALAVTSHAVLRLSGEPYWADLLQMAFIASYLPWFLLGVAAFEYEHGHNRASCSLVSLAGLLLLLLVVAGENKADFLVFCLVAVLLFSPKKSQRISRVLAHPYLVGIGVASYSLYLLHERIGLTLISVIAEKLALTGAAALPVSLVVGVVLVFVSQIIYRYWEGPLNRVVVKSYSKWAIRDRQAAGKCAL